MASELPGMLLEATLATSAALVLVLAARQPLRRLAGAGVAYATWALVPLAGLAALLPAAPGLPGPIAPMVQPLHGAAREAGVAMQASGTMHWLLLAWLAGALALAMVFAARQWRFGRQLRERELRGDDGGAPLGPAVVGLWRPRIVLPSDFGRRYTPEEQQLVLEHERQHLRRGDLWAQALCAGLRCLFWFNPLMHLAASRFRFDQELACDADVLARHPRARRRYGEVMLKTQLADFGLPLGCHWQSCHPLKERIAMLTRPLPSARRTRVAGALLAASMAALTFAAWAAEPAAAKSEPLQSVTSHDVLDAPKYPAEALEQGIEGTVWLEVLVGADGVPKEVKVKKSSPGGVFDQAAVDAAWQWRFNAGRRGNDGEKVEGWVVVPVQFAKNEPAPADTPRA
ncbi:TonB family protein [Arenimonas caeni]|jgi:TonB family protein|uniref:Energy transducer TonB n=1 Tax=Arenimonas caeni TaxID=2058085 RepID=A0A2P6MCD0_9GAMM|nr:TonB family protein [Arenimonas caeni]MDY0021053.1 TonB family protein [Arenimonas caeni]PRH83611.1 energy transducer TonB [Arenimonas caeni]